MAEVVGGTFPIGTREGIRLDRTHIGSPSCGRNRSRGRRTHESEGRCIYLCTFCRKPSSVRARKRRRNCGKNGKAWRVNRAAALCHELTQEERSAFENAPLFHLCSLPPRRRAAVGSLALTLLLSLVRPRPPGRTIFGCGRSLAPSLARFHQNDE